MRVKEAPNRSLRRYENGHCFSKHIADYTEKNSRNRHCLRFEIVDCGYISKSAYLKNTWVEIRT